MKRYQFVMNGFMRIIGLYYIERNVKIMRYLGYDLRVKRS